MLREHEIVGSNPTDPTKFMRKRKYLRWHPVKNDPTGTFRGDGCEKLNAGVMDSIHEHALKVNARIDRSRKMILEIRAAEGGEDAKLLVEEQITIYARVASRRGL